MDMKQFEEISKLLSKAQEKLETLGEDIDEKRYKIIKKISEEDAAAGFEHLCYGTQDDNTKTISDLIDRTEKAHTVSDLAGAVILLVQMLKERGHIELTTGHWNEEDYDNELFPIEDALCFTEKCYLNKRKDIYVKLELNYGK